MIIPFEENTIKKKIDAKKKERIFDNLYSIDMKKIKILLMK